MQITSINYKRTYNLGNYSSESIGLDADLELGENPETAMTSLKKQVEELHRQNNPQLWANYESSDDIGTSVKKTPPPPDQKYYYQIHGDLKEEPKLTGMTIDEYPKTLAEQIRSCKELKVLESYKLLIQKDEQAKAAYLEMLEKLSPKQNA